MARKLSNQEALVSAIARKLHERLAPRDVRLLERCWSRQDVDLFSCPTLGVHQAAWLIHHRLLTTYVDRVDRVWVETTQLGRDLVRHIKKGMVQCGSSSVVP